MGAVWKKKDLPIEQPVEKKDLPVEKPADDKSMPVESTFSAWEFMVCDLLVSIREELKRCNGRLENLENLSKQE